MSLLEKSPEARLRAIRAVRSSAAAFDDPSSGALLVGGKDRGDLLQRLTTNEVKTLAPGQGAITCFTTAKGRVVDRVRVLAEADSSLLITSAGRADPVAKWIDRYVITEDVKVRDLSNDVAQIHLLGPRALEVAAGIDRRAMELPPSGHLTAAFAGIEPVTVARTEGLLAAPGALMIVPRDRRDALLTALRAVAIATLGEELPDLDPTTFDALRVEAGLPLFGRDFSEDNNPLEAGLWDSVSFDKGCYVGQEVVARLRNYDKVMKQLCRLRIAGDDPVAATTLASLAPGTKLFADGRETGTITSAAGPPQIAEWRALGYVSRRVVQAGTPIAAGAADSSTRLAVIEPVHLR